MIFIGSVGAYLYPELKNNNQILLHIAEIHFPGVLYGIFIIAMIGVVMSSMDTLLNNGGVCFAEDVLASVKHNISDKFKLFYSKVYTILDAHFVLFTTLAKLLANREHLWSNYPSIDQYETFRITINYNRIPTAPGLWR